ncbi:MAG: hypothetical protein NZ651_05850 [Candidatus Bipolaricaulota bacterium]|nr:hypothetical protein [Candidatus Bipolaricaulota bacterium]MDW8127277.1 hypothetical protein [Candidatus Bipolaricaulota bacterium]
MGVKRLVALGPEVRREFDLDLSRLKPKGTELIPLFRDHGLPCPVGAPRRLRRDLPDRFIFFEPVTLASFARAKELESPEKAIQNLYATLEAELANRGRVYYAGATMTWQEFKELRLTLDNLVRLSVDRLLHRTPDFRRYRGELYVRIEVDVLVGQPFPAN